MKVLFWQEDHPIVKGGAETWLKETAKGLKLLGHETSWLQSDHIQQAIDSFKPNAVILGTLHVFNKLRNVDWLAGRNIPAVWFLHDYWPFCVSRMLLLDHNLSDQPCAAVKGICVDSCEYREKPWVLELVNRFYAATGCEGAAEIMRRNGVNVKAVVEEGIDTDLFKPGGKWCRDEVYSSASGHDMWKGFHILEEACGNDIPLEILTGLSRIELAEKLSHVIFYVFPSVYQEIWGLALTEAMACGCTVIASDVAGARAQIHPGLGLLVPPNDVLLLRETINWLLEKPFLAVELGNRARRHVVEDHSLLAVGSRWEKVLEEIMGGE